MKKVGILTITDFNNYGNRLQCYALQRFINNMGYESKQIYFKKTSIKRIIKSYIKYALNYKNHRALEKRKKFFTKFTNNYIDYYTCRKIDQMKFDTFIVGSDQVWNPYFKTTQMCNFLTFADKTKRNSYAASFGVSEIPDDYKEEYKILLKEFNNISVREDAGVGIIKNLTGREDTTVVVDPTMLITADEWSKLENKPSFINEGEKYILLYFLGKISDERKKKIDQYAEQNNCRIINILDKNSKYYITGPSEFLYLEKNAEAIFTDSFHSVVFSLIFNRPFLVFGREDSHANMNSRVETLLTKFELTDKKFEGKLDQQTVNNNYDIQKILNAEVRKSEEFIKKIMNN